MKKSEPISIPKPTKIRKNDRIIIATWNHEYKIEIESISSDSDIIKGTVISTPDKKHFVKGDIVILHRDNVLKVLD